MIGTYISDIEYSGNVPLFVITQWTGGFSMFYHYEMEFLLGIIKYSWGFIRK